MIDEDQKWSDAGITCGPEGWTREQVDLGMKAFFIWARESNRRVPDANWFELIAVIGRDDRNPVRVLKHARDKLPVKTTQSGELFFFANDLDNRYGNNMGSLRVEIQRKS